MTYPQQPRQQPYGQQPGWPPPPGPGAPYPGGPQPRKNGKTGLVVGMGVAVVALVVFTITAFVAPGFLLGDEDSGGTSATAGDDGGSGGCGAGGVPDDGGVQDGSAQKVNALVSKIVQGFCDKDKETLTQLICPGSEHVIQPYVDEAEYVEEFALQGAVNDAGPTATATVRSVLENGSQRVE
ncbi:MAG: hypothetical protein M3422_24475, partial [Actinomycetota bacterium]|nr:hypothetical protein [Actinomycetota bacterium]